MGRDKCLFPFGQAVTKAKVRVEKMSARSQHPRYLCQESREVCITVRRFDIDNPIEGAGRKRQVFRVTLDEDQPRNLMTLFAKANSRRIQIQGGVALRLKRARKVSCSATMPTAYLQYVFSTQRSLRGDVVIKLDANAIQFVFRRKRDAHGRFLFVGVVEE